MHNKILQFQCNVPVAYVNFINSHVGKFGFYKDYTGKVQVPDLWHKYERGYIVDLVARLNYSASHCFSWDEVDWLVPSLPNGQTCCLPQQRCRRLSGWFITEHPLHCQMRDIVERVCHNYKSDFYLYDLPSIPDPDKKEFLWAVREHGTNMLVKYDESFKAMVFAHHPEARLRNQLCIDEINTHDNSSYWEGVVRYLCRDDTEFYWWDTKTLNVISEQESLSLSGQWRILDRLMIQEYETQIDADPDYILKFIPEYLCK